MNDLVSVIIIFQNLEKYLEECLNSVINQTYKNLEIICVDDCSSDNSYYIIEKFSKIDKRIKILKNDEIMGPGGARNVGLKNSSGEFIYFIDGDDYIDNNYIENFILNFKDADVVCNNKIIKFYENGTFKFIKDNNTYEKYKVINFEKNIYNSMSTSAWSKCYRRSFLIKNKIFFAEKLKFEDFYFINILITKIKKIVFVDNSTYHYRQRAGSIIDSYKTNNDFMDPLIIIKMIYNYYKDNNIDYEVPFKWLYKFLKKHKNKNVFFLEIKEFLKSVILDTSKYTKKNKTFIKSVLNSNSYISFCIKYNFYRIF